MLQLCATFSSADLRNPSVGFARGVHTGTAERTSLEGVYLIVLEISIHFVLTLHVFVNDFSVQKMHLSPPRTSTQSGRKITSDPRNWTALPSKQFLHAASRVPPETRHPERVALQHASLPHWHTWLEGSRGFSWESFTWNPRIQLAMQVVQDSLDDVATGHLERADATLPTFALKDLHCRGRAGLSEECRWRREQNFRRIKQ